VRPAARKAAPDQDHRDAAILERKRNVLVDAGAGTGKTTILVERFVKMVAPTGGAAPIPIGRLAAITFTRKAAGELRLRIRERLLELLAPERPESEQAERLRGALAGLDTSYVGTIHSFADRLLRLRPVEAQLSPSYELVEDDESLLRETFAVLLEAVQGGTLEAELRDTGVADRAAEAERTIRDMLAVGLPAESREREWQVDRGLDALVEGFVRQRDLPPPDAPPVPPDLEAFRAAADEFVSRVGDVHGGSPGGDWMVGTAGVLRRLCDVDDPVAAYGQLKQQLDRVPRSPITKKHTFSGEEAAWRMWKRYDGADPECGGALRDELLAPFHRWMASRVVRLFPVVVALHERVKARSRKLDLLDPLLRLRDLLVRDFDVRGQFQRMFDHVFVDEFQDTDPLQAEIVLYLCESRPRARRWEGVDLADGKLTLVGDPKQSIYRFRRADVAMYDRVRQMVAGRDHLSAVLTANFRAVPPLIAWFNDRFERILGVSTDGRPFDPGKGRVFHQPLVPGREVESPPAVQVLELRLGERENSRAPRYRDLEARSLARYLRWIVETGDFRLVDPLDGRLRRPQYGDVAVLAASTTQLSTLFRHFDEEGIPYASRGGTLLLSDPLNRQFLLGLRALADPDDGVAEAALFAPPFFGVDPLDLASERATTGASGEGIQEGALRLREAREIVGGLRGHRLERPPGATARDLLERTAFGRAVARGPNGTQRLARLREICLILEQLAANEGLDYDAATARMRAWVEEPVKLDPPHPLGTEAVQVMSVHQAKGLEFPAVVIWDSQAKWRPRSTTDAWRMDRDGQGWMLDLSGLRWEETMQPGMRERELAYCEAERRRLIYVAATRARDLLVIPKAANLKPGSHICADLLEGTPPELVQSLEPFVDGADPAWARRDGAVPQPARADGTEIQGLVDTWWGEVVPEAARPRFEPRSVSGEARPESTEEAGDFVGSPPRKQREGRFGELFGTTVHAAIGLVLRNGGLTPGEAVRRAAEGSGLGESLEEAGADVGRALAALEAEGLLRRPGPDLQIEYPVAAAWEGGALVSGYIDLVGATQDRIDVIDFKTDAPPEGPVEGSYPEYAFQVLDYGRLLEATGVVGGRRLRTGLLFTADGRIRWVERQGPRAVASVF
jgi:ATP-dependent helicase/nuclease subunit A